MPLQFPWPFPPSKSVNKKWNIASRITIAGVSCCSKVCMAWLNRLTVHNRDVLIDLTLNRPDKQPLVTVSNHHSCMDDPLLWGALRWSQLTIYNTKMRWSSGADDICFTRPAHTKFFALGRTVPIFRGEGVYQRSMDFLLEKLNNGEWVHMFPEGKVNLTQEFVRLKWGVGRLIAECKNLPTVLPIWHLGMDDVLPNKTPYIPKIGQKVTIFVGEPIDFGDVLSMLREAKKTPMEIRKHITDIIQEEFKRLKKKTEELHFSE